MNIDLDPTLDQLTTSMPSMMNSCTLNAPPAGHVLAIILAIVLATILCLAHDPCQDPVHILSWNIAALGLEALVTKARLMGAQVTQVPVTGAVRLTLLPNRRYILQRHTPLAPMGMEYLFPDRHIVCQFRRALHMEAASVLHMELVACSVRLTEVACSVLLLIHPNFPLRIKVAFQ